MSVYLGSNLVGITIPGSGGGGGGSVTQDQDGYIVLPSTGGGGSPSATQHTIHLEFSDNTNTDIDVYYDDSLLGTMITNYAPTTWTYNNKTVTLAQLDNVAWVDRTYTWETVLSTRTINYYPESGTGTLYPYCWISELSDVVIPEGSIWRITYDGDSYVCVGILRTLSNSSTSVIIGNPKYTSDSNFVNGDGSDVPCCFFWSQYGAWSGGCNSANENVSHVIKIERAVTA